MTHPPPTPHSTPPHSTAPHSTAPPSADTRGHDDHHGPAHLAHHFETSQQQLSSAKLGMWVFLATEILMFGGLFCAYSVWRGNHPEVFEYAHTALNKNFGFINTIFLITSSFTMAWAVRTAQLGKTKPTVILMILTLMGGCAFLVVKTIEYRAKWDHNLFVGYWHNEHHPNYIATEDGGHGGGADVVDEHATLDDVNADHDNDHADPPQAVFPSEGLLTHADERPTSEHTIIPLAPDGPAGVVSDWLVPTVTADDAPDAPDALGIHADGEAHTRGGMDDAHDAVAAIADVGGDSGGHGDGAGDDGTGGGHNASKDIVPLKDQGKIHQFFQIYFLMTGLHTFHVIVGMIFIFYFMLKAAKGTFGPEYYTPVDLVGLYWHLVDLIWIFLFPLLYLIH